MYKRQIQKGDVLIAISSQRIFKEVLDTVKVANDHELITVAFTDSYTNVLASECEYTLAAPVGGLAIDCSHVASLAMLNVLINRIAVSMPDRVIQNLERENNKCKDKDLFYI